jgi:hypothetical protein
MTSDSEAMKPNDIPEAEVSGSLSDAEVLDIVHSVCTKSKDGVLEVHSEFGTGRIALRSGRVCHAQIADVQGEAAFTKIASATTGEFRLLPPEQEEKTSIIRPLEDLLVDTMRLQQYDQQGDAAEELPEPKAESLYQMVQGMKLTEKMRFALRCDKEGRTLLIRDPNRAIQLAIITNPRITDAEVTILAWSKSSDDEVLRRIAENREWVKYYPVRLGLATNPKTPISISTKLLPTLMPEDLSQVAKSKEVPVTVAHAARRLILQKR